MGKFCKNFPGIECCAILSLTPGIMKQEDAPASDETTRKFRNSRNSMK